MADVADSFAGGVGQAADRRGAVEDQQPVEITPHRMVDRRYDVDSGG